MLSFWYLCNLVFIPFLRENNKMKKALIHDWLDLYGGAERVLTAISEIYEFDFYYAYVNKMSQKDLNRTFQNKPIVVEDSKKFKGFKFFFRFLMPFFPYLVKSFNKQTKNNEIDLVISSSWALSKGYRIGNETHISYLHCRNFKYVWDEAYLYFKGPFKLLSFLKKPLREFDIKSAQNPDYLITNSKFVQNWVRQKYNRESTVIYPPVEVEEFYISNEKEDYFIPVGRIVTCKRFEIIVEAFARNGKNLLIVGDGSARKKLEKNAPPNVKFIGFKTKEELKTLLSKARAFVFSAEEDFGIAIVEALASGIPVIAYSGGASTELITNENGILYNQQSSEALNKTLKEFIDKEHCFEPKKIRESAMKFSKKRFQKEFSSYIDKIIANKKIK